MGIPHGETFGFVVLLHCCCDWQDELGCTVVYNG